MKRVLSFLIAVFILASSFCAVIFAESDAPTESTDIGSVTSCIYNPKNNTVNISGNINHDILITKSDYDIELYLIPFGADYVTYLASREISPLAGTNISVKFEFAVKADDNEKRYSGYCVVITDKKGTRLPISAPQYPTVAGVSSFTEGDKSAFKGISASMTSVAVATNASSTIIPIYLNQLLSSTTTGILFSYNGTPYYFDSDYITELDRKVRSFMATGATVYLQYLSYKNGNPFGTLLGNSSLPDMSESDNIDKLSLFTAFLADRYNDKYLGAIGGFVLGSRIDLEYSQSFCSSVDEFVANYAHYAYVVGTVARLEKSTINVVIPFSDEDSYSYADTQKECSASILTERICEYFDDRVTLKFEFMTLIETDALPYSISEETLKNGNFSNKDYNGINADRAKIYSDYLTHLSSRHKSAPGSYIFLWNIPSNESYNVLSTSYAYTYYKLLSDKNLFSFVASFNADESDGESYSLETLNGLIKLIDTNSTYSVTEAQLKLLGAQKWSDIINPMYGGNYALSTVTVFNKLPTLPADALGSYSYCNFAYQTDLSSWFAGNNCTSLKIDYNEVTGSTLEAHFAKEEFSPAEFSEFFCAYEYHESYTYTPYMTLNFSLKNDIADPNSLYQVKFTFGSSEHSSEVSVICSPGEKNTLHLDFSKYNESAKTEYIKISTRCISGNTSGYTFCFASMDGTSIEYRSEDLSNLILEERLNIKDTFNDNIASTEEARANTVVVVAGVSIIILVIGIGIFMCVKKDEEYSE